MFSIRMAIAGHKHRLTELQEARQVCLAGLPHPIIGDVRNIRDLHEARAAQAKIKRETAEWSLLIADVQSEIDVLKEKLAEISASCNLYSRKYEKFALCLDRHINSIHTRQRRAEESENEELYYARITTKS